MMSQQLSAADGRTQRLTGLEGEVKKDRESAASMIYGCIAARLAVALTYAKKIPAKVSSGGAEAKSEQNSTSSTLFSRPSIL